MLWGQSRTAVALSSGAPDPLGHRTVFSPVPRRKLSSLTATWQEMACRTDFVQGEREGTEMT